MYLQLTNRPQTDHTVPKLSLPEMGLNISYHSQQITTFITESEKNNPRDEGC